MRKYFLFLALFCIQAIHSQSYKIDLDAKILKNYSKFKSGTRVKINSMDHRTHFDIYTNKIENSYTLSTSVGEVDVKEKLENILQIDYKDVQDFWNAQIIFNVLEELSKRGTQYDLRDEIEDDALEYVNWAVNSGLEFKDPFLETYIYRIINKISPKILIDGRPGVVNLLILRSINANAWMYPNGTLVITTGLISLLHSEDELAAILAHEIAHFILDHGVQNYNKTVRTQKRAEFWAGLATVMTGVAEGITAANNRNYIPGFATLAVAAASSQIAEAVSERIGMNYSREQEKKADKIATELITYLGYSPNALSTALSRIEELLKEERSLKMYFASDHPALVQRIKDSGKPYKKGDKMYEKTISFAVSDAARWKMQNRRYCQALPLLNQNIYNAVATVDDYIMKANCLLYMNSDIKSFEEVLGLLDEAKKISPNNLIIYKTEITAYLQQKKHTDVKELLKAYKERLMSCDLAKTDWLPSNVWSAIFHDISSEKMWVDDMIQKMKGF